LPAENDGKKKANEPQSARSSFAVQTVEQSGIRDVPVHQDVAVDLHDRNHQLVFFQQAIIGFDVDFPESGAQFLTDEFEGKPRFLAQRAAFPDV
jgi:hypothetical protein